MLTQRAFTSERWALAARRRAGSTATLPGVTTVILAVQGVILALLVYLMVKLDRVGDDVRDIKVELAHLDERVKHLEGPPPVSA